VSLRLACHATSPCKGVVSITIKRPGKHYRARKVSLGTVRFEFRAAGSGRLILSLNAYAHALLAKGETLHTTVTVAMSGSSPARFTAPLTIRPTKR
jgi:hypothetical protein